MTSASPVHGGPAQIHFDDVGQIGQRLARVVHREVVERNQISGFLQMTTRRDHQVIHGDRLQNLDHGLGGGQQSNVILEQHVAGAVDEGAASITEDVEPHQHGSAQSVARSRVSIRVTEIILHAVAEEQFVAENLLVGAKNRLPRHKLGSGFGGWLRFTGAEGRNRGVHA